MDNLLKMWSLPLWKCGLKCLTQRNHNPLATVTSLVEVWIEILVKKCVKITKVVTSLVEVWIEIYTGGS